MPATVPLPTLISRALALFSGLAPQQAPHPEWPAITADRYTCVSYEAAQLLAAKLGQPELKMETA